MAPTRLALAAGAMILLSGCLVGSNSGPKTGPDLPGLVLPSRAADADPSPGRAALSFRGGAHFTMDLPVRIVLVGFESFDEAAFRARLEQPLAPFPWIRHDTTGLMDVEALRYRVNYSVHSTPSSFAQELFAYAASVGTSAAPDAYLASYDRAGERRVCAAASGGAPPPCRPILRIDAMKVEAWLQSHRLASGAGTDDAGYTIFVLDSYTKGYLPKDSYHQYFIDDGTGDANLRNLRAWGGAHDFVFLDVGAGPNAYDVRPWGNFSREDATLHDLEDYPIWEYASDSKTFYENLARNVNDATSMLWARTPIYPFEFSQKYVLPVYVFIDPRAHANPASPFHRIRPTNFEANTDKEGFLRSFQELLPWAEVEVQWKFVYLPDGDRGVQAAIDDARSRFVEHFVDYGILKKYFRENWAKYAPPVEGAVVYPTFAFVLEYPAAGIFAYADGDEMGRSWGVFINIADAYLCLRATQPVCSTPDMFANPAAWWALWNVLLSHELGHSVGLTHTHDGPGVDERGFGTYRVNWLWDSTASAMTYRHSLQQFDTFDKELLLRAHTVNLSLQVLTAPGASADAQRLAREALSQVQAGQYATGLSMARAARGALASAPTVSEDLGVRSTPQVRKVDLPGSPQPVGCLPILYYYAPFVGPFDPACPYIPLRVAGVTYAEIPITLPPGTRAFEIEYRERDAPTHWRWTTSVSLRDAKGEWLTLLSNNGHDKAVYLRMDHCMAGCKIRLDAWSGANLSYDVIVTPYLGRPAGPTT